MTRVEMIPQRMQHLERDARGYPIPFNIWRDTDGRPHFTINDHERAAQCIAELRCPICGQPHDETMWFVGGPMSAFHEHGAYLDQPMHSECAHYAIKVCPYLAAPKYAKRLDAATVDPAKMPEHVLFVDPTSIPDRPDVFVMVEASSYRVTIRERHLIPLRPYKRVEFWRGGVQLSEQAAVAVLRAAAAKE